jgi:hypothetical protein
MTFREVLQNIDQLSDVRPWHKIVDDLFRTSNAATVETLDPYEKHIYNVVQTLRNHKSLIELDTILNDVFNAYIDFGMRSFIQTTTYEFSPTELILTIHKFKLFGFDFYMQALIIAANVNQDMFKWLCVVCPPIQRDWFVHLCIHCADIDLLIWCKQKYKLPFEICTVHILDNCARKHNCALIQYISRQKPELIEKSKHLILKKAFEHDSYEMIQLLLVNNCFSIHEIITPLREPLLGSQLRSFFRELLFQKLLSCERLSPSLIFVCCKLNNLSIEKMI